MSLELIFPCEAEKNTKCNKIICITSDHMCYYKNKTEGGCQEEEICIFEIGYMFYLA